MTNSEMEPPVRPSLPVLQIYLNVQKVCCVLSEGSSTGRNMGDKDQIITNNNRKMRIRASRNIDTKFVLEMSLPVRRILVY